MGASRSWQNETVFSERLTRVVGNIQKMVPGAKLQMVIPPPMSFEEKHRIAAGIVKDILPKLIPQVAGKLKINCIDCYSALEVLKERQGLKEDGIHISPVGARKI